MAAGLVLLTINIFVQLSIYTFGLKKEWFLLFNMDKEMNLPTLYSVGLLTGCASIIKLINKKKGKVRENIVKQWNTLHWIFLFLALDEAFQIHEILIIPDLKPLLPALLTIVWVIPYGILVIFLMFYFRPLIISLPHRIKTLFFISGAIYISGALGVEMIGSYLVRTGDIRLHGLSYGLITTLEESMEIFGLILFIYSLLSYAFNTQKQRLKVEIRVRSRESLK